MPSERANGANRRNAQASTGPRTREGKARSGQNARKHGLSAVGFDPSAETEIERLAELLAAEHGRDATVLRSARAVAEAQFQLQRVMTVKTALLRSRASACEAGKEPDGSLPTEFPEDLFDHLEGLERYERRALSRRKFAARRFNELVSRATRLMTEPDSG